MEMHRTTESWLAGPDCTGLMADQGFHVISALLAKVLLHRRCRAARRSPCLPKTSVRCRTERDQDLL